MTIHTYVLSVYGVLFMPPSQRDTLLSVGGTVQYRTVVLSRRIAHVELHLVRYCINPSEPSRVFTDHFFCFLFCLARSSRVRD